METHKHSFNLKIDLSELNTLSRQLQAFGKSTELSEDSISEVNICLDELFTNIVSYGCEDNLEPPIIFTLTLINDELTIKVEDEGIPFNPLTVKNPEVMDDLNNIQIGGLGVYIVKELMDDICYKRYRGKNHLTLKKQIQKDKCLW
jgi:anti-sigma regulatory factor (Ser/Thr protein kinase)